MALAGLPPNWPGKEFLSSALDCVSSTTRAFSKRSAGGGLSKGGCCVQCLLCSSVVLVHSLGHFLNRTAGGGLSKGGCCGQCMLCSSVVLDLSLGHFF